MDDGTRNVAIRSPYTGGPFERCSFSVKIGDNVAANDVIFTCEDSKGRVRSLTSPVEGIVVFLDQTQNQTLMERSIIALVQTTKDVFEFQQTDRTMRVAKSHRSVNMFHNRSEPMYIEPQDFSIPGIEEKIPLAEENLRAFLSGPPFTLYLENSVNCATVRFDYESTAPLLKFGIIAYRVDWDYSIFPNHYTNHENVIYYLFLNESSISAQMISDALQNPSYLDADRPFPIKQLVSNYHLHLQNDGRFVCQPNPIMGTVATAIGLQRVNVWKIPLQ